jgi:SAM-dependent methyltransferase
MDSNKIKSLDLGCGKEITKLATRVDEYYGLDIIESDNPNIKKCDLFVDKIPFDDNTFDYVTAVDFMEHVPRVVYYKDKLHHPFIHVMNEVYRVLKIGGSLFISVPVLDSSNFFYRDPTHVNPVSMETMFYYFSTIQNKKPNFPWANNYGFDGNFDLLKHNRERLLHFKEGTYYQDTIILKKINRVSSEV